MHLEPLPRRARMTAVVGELEGARHLAPDQEAEAVGPEQEARVLDLLVQARGGEAELLDQLDLGAERRGAGGGEVRLRPVALREHGADRVRPVVEEEVVPLRSPTERRPR